MITFSILGILLIIIVLIDGFESVILPRRVKRRIRLSRIFYKTLWRLWIKGKKLFPTQEASKDYLGFFGPLSLIILLCIWAIGLIIGFALINYGLHTDIKSPGGIRNFITYLYLSGGTFFPVEQADTYPIQVGGKFLAILEGGLGFAFLAMVIGYLPVLYQGFSKREVNINLLDSHAGSPPSALYLLQQLSKNDNSDELKPQFEKWEVWCAELLETHISYPVLAYYRSQHDDQSWLAALLMILDASTLVLTSEKKSLHAYAKSTFAIARHATVDLTQAFYLTPKTPSPDRLSKKDLATLKNILKDSDFPLRDGQKADKKLIFLRKLYEPNVQTLSEYFLMPITPFVTNERVHEAWRNSI